MERRSEDLLEITRDVVLTRGLGRSYGDASLPPETGGTVAATPRADRFLSFDAECGRVRAEAGVRLGAINDVFLRRGWAPPVSPGTEDVTLGGMVAADVHGKNHHKAGCFGEFVDSILLRVADGSVIEVSDAHEPELFRATIGGMGLTGHILEAAFQMVRIPSPWIEAESERIRGLERLLEALRDASATWPFTVGWVDGFSTGHAVLIRGRWAESGPGEPERKRRRSYPAPPLFSLFVRTYNAFYYRRAERAGPTSPFDFFYPLDGVRDWNRFYGARGFTQYQCILPRPRDILDLFALLRSRRAKSYLCVVKDCGPEGRGTLSFPHAGMSLALDLPLRKDTQPLVDALNERVIDLGGRIYLAKDALTRAEHYRAMDPRVEGFNRVRRRWDPERRFQSALSRRLLGDGE